MDKQELETRVNDIFDRWILTEAKAWDYKSAADLVSYTNSTNVGFKAEADAFIAWRDAMVEHYIQWLADIAVPGDGIYTDLMVEATILVDLPVLVRP